MPKDNPTLLLITNNIHTKHFIQNNIQDYFIIDKKHAEEGIKIAENTNLAIVIIDENIDMDPIDICFKIKKRKRLFSIPIIFITAHFKKSYIEKAKKAGFTHFLNLPLNKDQLMNTLNECKTYKTSQKKVANIFKLKKGKNK